METKEHYNILELVVKRVQELADLKKPDLVNQDDEIPKSVLKTHSRGELVKIVIEYEFMSGDDYTHPGLNPAD